ncbi:MAG: NADP-dependent oxidoreductase [Clostridiaceae bacterium]
MAKLMKALVIRSFGDPDVFSEEELDIPTIKTDEVLIKVAATSFNPADNGARKGYFGELISVDPYKILGLDLSGVIEAVGADVTGFKVGDKVFANLNIRDPGSYAEYTVVKPKDLCLAPVNLTLKEAGVLPLASLTAFQGLYELGELKEGQRVMINGAGGGVGSIAVQMAKHRGAFVVAVGSNNSIDVIRKVNPNQILNYKEEDITETLKEKVDLIINLARLPEENMIKMLKLIKPNGKFVSTTGTPQQSVENKDNISIVALNTKRGGERLKEIKALVENGAIRPIITKTFSLKDIPEVHKMAEEGNIHGKISIIVDESLAALSGK